MLVRDDDIPLAHIAIAVEVTCVCKTQNIIHLYHAFV
jgi:hypothetical protein